VRLLLETLAKELVEEPKRVSVREEVEDGVTYFTLRVASGDRGRVIGKNGRTADALRSLLDAVAAQRGLECEMEIE
jgi:predicted RNA-binding protein YlqC (UPF0109 family)